MTRHRSFAILLTLFAAGAAAPTHAGDDGWLPLFNGKDTAGWKLRGEKIGVTQYFDADGKELPGAKATTLDQKMQVYDANGKLIPEAKIVEKGKKKVVVDADNKTVEGAKIKLTGGRKAIVDAKGVEVKDAKAVTKQVDNPSGWIVEKGELICVKPHGGNDILTEKKFTDFELHIEFQATSNSGVYLQGRYEIQVDNSLNAKPGKDGKLPNTMCGAIYGQIPPSKNMAKPPMEWQSFDVTFRAPRGANGKVTEPARVTLIWNGEKVIDDAPIKGPTGAALDGKVLEPGPLLLQGDHGRVAFRNIKIRPLSSK
jgi:3-keto-disaccharide hydrolase